MTSTPRSLSTAATAALALASAFLGMATCEASSTSGYERPERPRGPEPLSPEKQAAVDQIRAENKARREASFARQKKAR